MIHYTTKNKSFIKMHYILKEMGIKNNAFFLQLYDESLLNIDPLDEENLTIEQKARVHLEISRNIWYFLREIVRIPTTGETSQFELTRGTLAIAWAFHLSLDFAVFLPRQCYKTYTICVCMCHEIYWGSKNMESMFFGLRDALVVQNLKRVKEVRDNLPSYLNLHNPTKDIDNTKSIEYRSSGFINKVGVRAPGKSEDQADKIGRGNSIPRQFWDEFPHIPFVKKQYESSIFAYSTSANIREKTGERHGLVFALTAGSKKTKDGLWAYTMLKRSCKFSEIFYDITLQDGSFDRITIKEVIKNSAANKFTLYIEFMYDELSKGDDYLETMRSMCEDEQAFNREVLGIWDEDVEDHPLGRKRLNLIREHKKNPLKTLIVDKIYFLRIYKELNWIKSNSHKIVIGMDCSGNLGRDFSTLVASDITTGETIAVMRINIQNVVRWAVACGHILKTIFTQSVVIIERNHVGATVCDIIGKMIGFKRIYKDVDGKYGAQMNVEKRKLFYGIVIRTSIDELYKVINDQYIIDEIVDLKRGKNGRIDHKYNGHDDTLISWLYTRWFCSICPNKNKYFDPLLFNCNIYDNDNKNEVYMGNKYLGKIYRDNSHVLKTSEELFDEKNKQYQENMYIDDDYEESVDDVADRFYEYSKNLISDKHIDIIEDENNEIEYVGDIDEDDDRISEKVKEIEERKTVKPKYNIDENTINVFKNVFKSDDFYS